MNKKISLVSATDFVRILFWNRELLVDDKRTPGQWLSGDGATTRERGKRKKKKIKK